MKNNYYSHFNYNTLAAGGSPHIISFFLSLFIHLFFNFYSFSLFLELHNVDVMCVNLNAFICLIFAVLVHMLNMSTELRDKK